MPPQSADSGCRARRAHVIRATSTRSAHSTTGGQRPCTRSRTICSARPTRRRMRWKRRSGRRGASRAGTMPRAAPFRRGCRRSREAARSIASARAGVAPRSRSRSVAPGSRGAAASPTARPSAANPQQDAESSERARDIAIALADFRRAARGDRARVLRRVESERDRRAHRVPLGTVKTRARLALEKLRAPLAQHREEAR